MSGTIAEITDSWCILGAISPASGGWPAPGLSVATIGGVLGIGRLLCGASRLTVAQLIL